MVNQVVPDVICPGFVIRPSTIIDVLYCGVIRDMTVRIYIYKKNIYIYIYIERVCDERCKRRPGEPGRPGRDCPGFVIRPPTVGGLDAWCGL